MSCAVCAKRKAATELIDKLTDGDLARINRAIKESNNYADDRRELRRIFAEVAIR